jgi:hypothetical protein
MDTMKIVDSSYFDDDDQDPGFDPELIPVDMSGFDDGEDSQDDTSELTIKQITPSDLEEKEKSTQFPQNLPQEEDVIKLLLRNKGIEDPSAILFEEEDGTETTKDFYSLTKQEQLELLESSDADINYGLEDNEIETVNFLRENDITLQELLDYTKQQAIEEFQNAQAGPFEIDNYTDEELFVLDLKAKFDDFTNEELEIELTKALENPELFKKKTDRIRSEYKTLEEQNRTAETEAAKTAREEAFTKITNSLVNVANQTEDMFGIDLEDQDKEDIIHSIVDRDINGVTPLVKALDDPTNLFKAAWFVTKGEEAFNLLHNYYRKEIEEVRKNSYQKGKTEALKGFPTVPINRVGQPASKQVTQTRKLMTMDELHNIND